MEAVTNTAASIQQAVKQLPASGKRRNIFLKSYNRRPNGKAKRAKIYLDILHLTLMGKARLQMIAAQLIPKYEIGGSQRGKTAEIVNSGVKEIITADMLKSRPFLGVDINSDLHRMNYGLNVHPLEKCINIKPEDQS